MRDAGWASTSVARRSALDRPTSSGSLIAPSGRPDLEEAFLDGYGADPRRPEDWRADRLAAAIGTAGWALAVGDEAFEQEGRRTMDELLDQR